MAHTKHGELDADLPIVLATVLRDHTSILSGVFPGHRFECDATGREGNSVCIGSYQEREKQKRQRKLDSKEKMKVAPRVHHPPLKGRKYLEP